MNFKRFYLQEEAEEPEDSVQDPNALEEPEEDYGHEFVDNETFDAPHINVEGVPDNSDPILNADEFLYSNADAQSFYARGNGFNITDNQDLYEVIKLIKDMTDRHLYMRELSWKVDVKNRRAHFIFRLGNEENDITEDFFLQGINQYVISELWKKYGPLYDVDVKFDKDGSGQNVMEMTVAKNKDEERKKTLHVPTWVPDSASFITKSSVSRI